MTIGVFDSKRHLTEKQSGQIPFGSLAENLVALWRLNETETVTVRDSLGVHDGSTIKINRAEEGVEGFAYGFYATDEFLTIPDHDDFSFVDGAKDLAFSISLWLYPTQIKYAQFINKEEKFNVEWDISMLAGGEIQVTLSSSANNRLKVKSTGVLTVNTWNHVTLSYSGSKTIEGVGVYINAQKQTMVDAGSSSYGGMKNAIADIVIGRSSYESQVDNFVGRIDEIAIWKNRYLLDSEVLDVMNGGLSIVADNYPPDPEPTAAEVPTTGLVAYYKLDGTTPGTAVDSHGTYTGTCNTTYVLVNQPGKVNTGFKFTGGPQYSINVGSLPIIRSLNMWVKLAVHTPATNGSNYVVDLNTNSQISYYPNPNASIYIGWLTSVRKTIGTGIVGDRTQWHMITVTADTVNDVWKFYQNGQVVFTGAVGTITMKTSCLLGYGFVDNIMDEVGFWDRPLSQEEILGMYNEGNGVTL